ncbi:MAG TPA: SIMPL domain-containing protein [Chloroflexota bacterium]|nr:SIMPL domain-containing protein [Chloroflexota bacterium]HUX88780.1 SIMPL domain-containing protein [Chloroflexota bacterium]
MLNVAQSRQRVYGIALTSLLVSGLVIGCSPNASSLQSARDLPTASASSGAAQTTSGATNPAGISVAPAYPASQANAVASVPLTASTTGGNDVTHGIVVTGNGTVSAPPDEAFVSAGVQTRATTAQDAQSQNNQTMQAVINAIKALGIPERDIQTSGISLYPIITQNQTVSGYNASNNVTVTVENINQAGAVLDAAVKAGANTATNVRFGFKDDTTLRNKALAVAATDARSKADALAKALGLTVTGIQSVSESATSVPFPLRSAGASLAAPAAVPVEPGEMSVNAQVTIVFSF